MAAREQDGQSVEKRTAPADLEQTQEGPVFQPAVDIFETPESLTVLVDMPGVRADQLKVDLRDDVLSIRGQVASPEGEDEDDVIREFTWGSFFRQFSLSETIDQGRIAARLTDGVLRLELPKVERAKPRRIEIATR